jgi:REP element-mobilizing transposase RayT
MAKSLSKILLHIIFSTKHRTPCLAPEICAELYPYMATVLKRLECPAMIVGGMEDHVHILCLQSRNITPAKLVEEVKKPTSKWLKSKGVDRG